MEVAEETDSHGATKQRRVPPSPPLPPAYRIPRVTLTSKDFRRIALAMNGAVEDAHMGHPDFRIHGRIFATLQPGLRTGMVVLTPEEQQRLVNENGDAFMPESGAWGRSGCTRVQLDAIDEELLGEAMTLAFQHISAKSSGAKKKARSAPRSMTLAAAVKMGAAMPDVEQSTTWGAPALKLRGKLMACKAINKSAEPNTLVVCVPAADRDAMIEAEPATYYLTDHYADGDAVLVRLSNIRADALRDLLQAAWRFVDAKAKAKRTGAARKTTRPSAPKARRAR
jgi:hypothetical protein